MRGSSKPIDTYLAVRLARSQHTVKFIHGWTRRIHTRRRPTHYIDQLAYSPQVYNYLATPIASLTTRYGRMTARPPLAAAGHTFSHRCDRPTLRNNSQFAPPDADSVLQQWTRFQLT